RPNGCTSTGGGRLGGQHKLCWPMGWQAKESLQAGSAGDVQQSSPTSPHATQVLNFEQVISVVSHFWPAQHSSPLPPQAFVSNSSEASKTRLEASFTGRGNLSLLKTWVFTL